jgi:hypothetical protein
VKTLPWNRAFFIQQLRRDIWRYVTPAANIEEQILQAAALLQLPPSAILVLARLQFLASRELNEMLEGLPLLLRRLANTTLAEEAVSIERLRGSIVWGKTIGLRAATGHRHLYVTAPARRAYQTPDNELLVFLLDAVVHLGLQTGWQESRSEKLGALVAHQTAQAQRWSQSRMLAEVERRPPTPRSISRVRNGRHRHSYRAVLTTYDLYHSLIAQLDRDRIREVVESRGLIVADDATLFELFCTFGVIERLKDTGWQVPKLELVGGALQLAATKGPTELRLYYHRVPKRLDQTSLYRRIQQLHGIAAGSLMPDLVLHLLQASEERWLLVEIKGGVRPVTDSAREALSDLLTYRRAYEPTLSAIKGTYGLGIAWGQGLAPRPDAEIMLCTPDELGTALAQALN